MTHSILISSLEEYSGKSALIIAIGNILQEEGYEIGYFKPFAVNPVKREGEITDEDAAITARQLGIDDDVVGLMLDRPYVEYILSAEPSEIRGKISEKYAEISRGKDVVFVEGSTDYKTGRAIGLGDFTVARLIAPKVLMVARYRNDFIIDKLLNSKDVFGPMLEKVIINRLMGYKLSYAQAVASRVIESAGMDVLGIIPHDPLLAGVFVSDLREKLGGEFIVKPEKDTIIEHLIIGAMSPSSALRYFRDVKNAVLITGGDRNDLLEVALSVPSIKCIVLTGNLEPNRAIIGRAEEKGVPVILVSEDTLTTTIRIEEIFRKARVTGEIKAQRIKTLVKNHIRIEELKKYLGLQDA
ncbi:phosphotransacetylase family protein [Geoglobus acetivorans]|uniref:BioD-like N-terminal domain of phosphotransacetylase n=1 Tax=Geoglobus acetivorans TaxID=565033 RepID=A0A0A7GEB5_GEOAI|nr:BioD-like N-terminal domain of phosphotransacetylase [Geoglobus acetivorans]